MGNCEQCGNSYHHCKCGDEVTMKQPKIEIQRFECPMGNLTKQGAINHVKELYEEGFVMTASEWRKDENNASTE